MYVHVLRNNGQLQKIIGTKNGIFTVVDLFYSIRQYIDFEDIDFIKKNITNENVKDWERLFLRGIDEDTDALFQLRLDVYDTYPIMLKNTYIDLKKLMQKCEVRAISLLSKMLKESIRKNENSLYRYADEFLYGEMDLFVTNYRFVLDTLLPFFPEVTEEIEFTNWSMRYSQYNSLERICVLLVKLASEAFAKNNPEEFIVYYQFAYGKANSIYNEIIIDALSYLDDKYADYVLDYLSKDLFINAFEDSSNNGNKLFLAKKAITRFTECCSDELIKLFEDRVIHYISPMAKDNLKRRIKVNSARKQQNEPYCYLTFWGDLQLEIIPCICKRRRSEKLDALLQVLKRRYYNNYKSIYDYEGDIRAYSVVSPVSGKKLSLNNWIAIITNKKITDSPKTIWNQKGEIAFESSLMLFSYAFNKFVSEYPYEVSVALLSLKNIEINDVFIDAYFGGLAISDNTKNIDESILAKVIMHFGYDYDSSSRAICIADVITNVTINKYKDYFVNVLFDIIKKHNNPKEEEQVVVSSNDTEGKTLEFNAINSVRGRAIRALSDLIWDNHDIYQKNKETLECIISDSNIYVKYASLFMLWSIMNYDQEWASKRIISLFRSDYRLAGFVESRRFFCICYKEYQDEISCLIKDMFSFGDDRLRRIAGYSIVELYMIGDLFKDVYSLYLTVDKEHRKPMLEMIITYFGVQQFREKAKNLLNKVILIEDDGDNEFLWGRLFSDKLLDISQDRKLIESILKSKISKNILNHFFEFISDKNMIKEFAELILELTISIIDNPKEIAYLWIVDTELLRFILGVYDVTANSEQENDKKIALRCLDVWDKMYEKNVGLARNLTDQLLCV